MNKICSTCKSEKSVEEFGKNKTTKDGLSKVCRACAKARDRKHYQNSSRREYLKTAAMLSKDRNRQFVFEYLVQHPCIDCGESDPVVLDFDHRGNKKNCVSIMVNNGCCLATLEKEIEKCDVRCANCHRKKTAKQFDWFRHRSSMAEQYFCKV